MKRALAWFETLDRRHALGAALVALLPFVIFHGSFRQLFWFGDEWDLLDQIDQIGFRVWTTRVFAENYVPLFKLAWGGTVYVFGGSYFALLCLLWLTHAFNTVLIGRLLRHAGFGWMATLFTQACFALVPDNIETLGWGVQWSAVLAVTFMLLGLDVHLRRNAELPRKDFTLDAVFWHAAASALCFSRGVLTGAVFWLATIWSTTTPRWPKRAFAGIRYLLPAIGVAVMIILYSSGNHRQLESTGRLEAALQYALWYFALNPFHSLLDVDSWGPVTTFLLGAAKVSLIVWALRRHSGAIRRLLVLLLAFDLGNAFLLGVGRFHTGLETTVSSRYQYGALLAMMPFAALWLEAQLLRVPEKFRRTGLILVPLLIVGWVCRHWPDEAAAFCDSRGATGRHLVFVDKAPPARGAVPGIPSMPTARAKELVQKYHLH